MGEQSARQIDRRNVPNPLLTPVGMEQCGPAVSFGSTPGATAGEALRSGMLIVIERRDLIRGCLACWLGRSCSEFTILAVSDVEGALQACTLEDVAAALIGVDAAEDGSDWLARQLTYLHTECADVPIILIVEPEGTSVADALAGKLEIQGFIPTSSNVAVAAAATRLVAAGGNYFPAARDPGPRKTIVEPASSIPGDYRLASARLTPREGAVLGVLASGAQNKIIAYRLGMSLSTVKAHVHSIIRKLNVRNRTEVVVAARIALVEESQHSDEEDQRLAAMKPPINGAHARPSHRTRTAASAM